MASQGLGHFLVGVFTFILCVIGLAIMAKHKIAALILFCIAGLWFCSVLFMKTSFVKEGEKARIGIFTLDTKLSQYDSTDLSPFKNIKLLINKDNTFEIKGYCAFLSATKGKWHYIDDGDINYTEYRFNNQEYSTQMQDASGTDRWILESCFAGKSRNHNKLVFVR